MLLLQRNGLLLGRLQRLHPLLITGFGALYLHIQLARTSQLGLQGFALLAKARLFFGLLHQGLLQFLLFKAFGCLLLLLFAQLLLLCAKQAHGVELLVEQRQQFDALCPCFGLLLFFGKQRLQLLFGQKVDEIHAVLQQIGRFDSRFVSAKDLLRDARVDLRSGEFLQEFGFGRFPGFEKGGKIVLCQQNRAGKLLIGKPDGFDQLRQ